MNSRFSLTKHASSSSGGTLWAQVQQITWRESLARWIMAGLASLWSPKHAGKGMLSLLLLLGVVMPVQAALIANYPCETDTLDHKSSSSKYIAHSSVNNGVEFVYDNSLKRTVCQFNKPAEGKTPKITDRYIKVPYSADFDLDSGPFTLSACVYQTKRNDSYTGMIFANRGTANGWLFGVAGIADSIRPGSLKFRVNDDWDTNTIRSEELAKIPNAELSPPPQWHSVALVYNGTTAQMYMDGASVGSKSLSSPGIRTPDDTSLFIGKNSETYLGKDVNDHHYWWYGKMSDLRIEDRALNPEDIKERATHCQGGYGTLDKNYPPTVNRVSVSPETGVAPLDVTLSAEVEDPDGDSFTVEYFDNGQLISGNKKPLTVGYHTIMAIATDSKRNRSLPGFGYINVDPNRPPTITNFPPPPTSIISGQEVEISATASDDDPGDSVTLNFFDCEDKLVGTQVGEVGKPVTATVRIKPTSIPRTTKLCSIKVTATDQINPQVERFWRDITVNPENEAPTSCFTPSTVSPFEAPAVGQLPKKVPFTACGGTLDDTTANADLKYQWLVDGQVQSTNPGSFDLSPGSFDLSVDSSVNKAVDYKVKLVVTDKEGLSTTSTEVTVHVDPFNQPPEPCFFKVIKDPSGTVPLKVTVNASECADKIGTNVDGILTKYEWKTSTGEITSGKTAEFTFNQVGEYSIELTVTDDGKNGKNFKSSQHQEKVVVKNPRVVLAADECKTAAGVKVKCATFRPKPGEKFSITFTYAVTYEEPVDLVDLALKFDPRYLQVDDVRGAGVLDNELAKEWDNEKGTINYAAMALGNLAQTEDFSLLTIDFTALEDTGPDGTPVKIDPEHTHAYYQGGLNQQKTYEEEGISIVIGDSAVQTQQCTVAWRGSEMGEVPVPPKNNQLYIYLLRG